MPEQNISGGRFFLQKGRSKVGGSYFDHRTTEKVEDMKMVEVQKRSN